MAGSLRGHGGSGLDEPLGKCRIGSYVEDVSSAAAIVGEPLILVGHSMGGFVVQKFLETHSAEAAVLLASAPPRSVGRAGPRTFRRHPWLALQTNVQRLRRR